ncbi:MAG TPA: hypothetical protein DIC45_10720, partial [Comamonadaceae bacterium]|nr:hypothetical protein [Comamonadaceae bacterium]
AGSLSGVQIGIAGNTSGNVQADGGQPALASSLLTEGSVSGSAVQIAANQGSASSGGGQAGLSSSVRVRQGASVRGSQVTVAGNQGSAQRGTAHSVDVAGSLHGGTITILGN